MDSPFGPSKPNQHTEKTVFEKVKQDLLNAIASGNSQLEACALVGIDRKTFSDYRAKDPAFNKAVSKARAYVNALANQGLVSLIKAGDFRAIEYRLSRAEKAKHDRLRAKLMRVELNRKRWELKQLKAGKPAEISETQHAVKGLTPEEALAVVQRFQRTVLAPRESGCPGALEPSAK